MGEWTSYSDQADLPMSQQWRDDMIARMSKVDTTKLTPKQKMQYKTLWRKLHGGGGSASEESTPVNWVVLVPVVALIVYWIVNSQTAPTATAQVVGGGPPTPIQPFNSQSSSAPLSSEAREARLRRFAE